MDEQTYPGTLGKVLANNAQIMHRIGQTIAFTMYPEGDEKRNTHAAQVFCNGRLIGVCVPFGPGHVEPPKE